MFLIFPLILWFLAQAPQYGYMAPAPPNGFMATAPPNGYMATAPPNPNLGNGLVNHYQGML